MSNRGLHCSLTLAILSFLLPSPFHFLFSIFFIAFFFLSLTISFYYNSQDASLMFLSALKVCCIQVLLGSSQRGSDQRFTVILKTYYDQTHFKVILFLTWWHKEIHEFLTVLRDILAILIEETLTQADGQISIQPTWMVNLLWQNLAKSQSVGFQYD